MFSFVNLAKKFAMGMRNRKNKHDFWTFFRVEMHFQIAQSLLLIISGH